MRLFFVCALTLALHFTAFTQQASLESMGREVLAAASEGRPDRLTKMFVQPEFVQSLLAPYLEKRTGVSMLVPLRNETHLQTTGEYLAMMGYVQLEHHFKKFGIDPKAIGWMAVDSSASGWTEYPSLAALGQTGPDTGSRNPTDAFYFFAHKGVTYTLSLARLQWMNNRWYPPTEGFYIDLQKAASIEEYLEQKEKEDALRYEDAMNDTTSVEVGEMIDYTTTTTTTEYEDDPGAALDPNFQTPLLLTGTVGKDEIEGSFMQMKLSDDATGYYGNMTFTYRSGKGQGDSVVMLLSGKGSQAHAMGMPYTGYMLLQKSATGFTGTWHSADGKETLPVKLTLHNK